jgi:hypothetical protein
LDLLVCFCKDEEQQLLLMFGSSCLFLQRNFAKMKSSSLTLDVWIFLFVFAKMNEKQQATLDFWIFLLVFA